MRAFKGGMGFYSPLMARPPQQDKMSIKWLLNWMVCGQRHLKGIARLQTEAAKLIRTSLGTFNTHDLCHGWSQSKSKPLHIL